MKILRELNKEAEKEAEKMKKTQNDLLSSLEDINSKVMEHQEEVVKLQTSLKESSDETAELKDRLENVKKTENNLESSTQTEESENYEVIAKELHAELIKVKDELLEMNNKNRKLKKEHQIIKSLNEIKSDS